LNVTGSGFGSSGVEGWFEADAPGCWEPVAADGVVGSPPHAAKMAARATAQAALASLCNPLVAINVLLLTAFNAVGAPTG
jgi:hypothetical protein